MSDYWFYKFSKYNYDTYKSALFLAAEHNMLIRFNDDEVSVSYGVVTITKPDFADTVWAAVHEKEKLDDLG